MKVNNEAKLFILSMVVVAVHTLTVDAPVKNVRVLKGHNVTLQCIYKSNAILNPGDFVFWMKQPKEVEIISWYLTDGGSYIDKSYSGRLNFSGNINNGDISITLNQVTMNDNGTYDCFAKIREDPPMTHTSIELLVEVPPSKPECKIIGTTQYGQNINLTCNSVEGSPKPGYSWQSYDAQNQPRRLIGTVMSGTLMLKNISADTTGYYICVSKNSVGEDMCNITVAVTPPTMDFALIGGVIGGIVAAIIIIAVIAYCCCCRKSKDEDYKLTEMENSHQAQPVKIRGPAEEEIQEEEEEESAVHSQLKPPTLRPSPKVSDVV
uniref:Glycoprotein A33 n=1 Tax=Salvator merianae TaxID=96440 RepID=A0A8D0B2Z7_SALMN